jgi:hypothetical protein
MAYVASHPDSWLGSARGYARFTERARLPDHIENGDQLLLRDINGADMLVYMSSYKSFRLPGWGSA